MLRTSVIRGLLFCMVATQASAATTKPAANRFENEIAAYERADRQSPPPKDAVLFMGSSTFRMWGKDVAEDFAPMVTINRGFGGSTFDDVLFYMQRMVIRYRPKAIVVYCGDNDIALGDSPQRVAENFRTFVDRARKGLGDVRIYYVSIKPSPSRWRLWPAMREANSLIREYAGRSRGLTFIDTATPMLKADGTPDRSLFRDDMLHMNRKGYEMWAPIMKKAMKDE